MSEDNKKNTVFMDIFMPKLFRGYPRKSFMLLEW